VAVAKSNPHEKLTGRSLWYSFRVSVNESAYRASNIRSLQLNYFLVGAFLVCDERVRRGK